MKYTVGWKPSAEQELAHLWLSAGDRGAVESAGNRIDVLLGSDPHNSGESRSGGTRILIIPPLAVFYQVSEPDRFVEVLQVWRTR